MPSDAPDLSQQIIDRCRDLGFAAAGVCEARPSRYERELREWLGANLHGSMGYLADNVDKRLDPTRVLEGARSIVMVADLYASRHESADEPPREGRGRIARYARGRDYHKVVKKRLHQLADTLIAEHPGASFRAFVDTAPVLEREHAARAGLGWVAKHTLLIHPELGSYTLLGGVLTTLELAPPASQGVVDDHCGACTRCIDACPTDAITPYSVDGSRCVSYLTIERRALVGERWFEGIGDWLVGCDLCQEVCPHNSARPDGHVSRGTAPNEAYRPRRDSFDLLEVLGWSEDDRREAFTTSSMKRVRLDMMKRNALIVAGNRPTDALRARIAELAEDASESEMVRETARLVARRLG